MNPLQARTEDLRIQLLQLLARSDAAAALLDRHIHRIAPQRRHARRIVAGDRGLQV